MHLQNQDVQKANIGCDGPHIHEEAQVSHNYGSQLIFVSKF